MQSQAEQQIFIRPARSSDVTELCALVNSAYRGDSGRRGWTTESDILAGQRVDEPILNEILSDNQSVILLAQGDLDQVVGCVHVKKTSTTSAYLGMLTTDPRRQAGGVGTRLLRAAESYARDIFNADRVEMTVISQRHELVAWYVKRGYKDTGEKRPFPYGDERFGIPLRNDLEFTVLQTRVKI